MQNNKQYSRLQEKWVLKAAALTERHAKAVSEVNEAIKKSLIWENSLAPFFI